MPNHIALLRAINVGGRNLIGMSNLREFLEGLGFAGAKTLLQSGNAVFRGDRQSSVALERLLEVETEKRFRIAVDYFVRTAKEWETVIARNPFPEEAKIDPAHLLVMFLKEAPEAKSVNALQSAIKGPEKVRSDGKHLYAIYPDGVGKSKLTNTVIERTLGTRGTGRNWNTILKLAALVRE
jgi:uncharacterized protein (DUF1697 family)